MCREPREKGLVVLETNASNVVGQDWRARLDKSFQENLGKFRKYDGKSVQDLLRALRNKVNRLCRSLPAESLTHFAETPLSGPTREPQEATSPYAPRISRILHASFSPTIHACSQCCRVLRFTTRGNVQVLFLPARTLTRLTGTFTFPLCPPCFPALAFGPHIIYNLIPLHRIHICHMHVVYP